MLNELTFFQNSIDWKTINLASYCEKISSFSDILFSFQQKGLFKNTSDCSYTMSDFLKEKFINKTLDTPISQFLNKELTPSTDSLAPNLSSKTTAYVELIIDVLNNKLAYKKYEQVSDRESVNERTHALQAAKISSQIYNDPAEVLMLLLHDIARVSIDDATHGHKNHCVEGSRILAPLQLPMDFVGLHAFAKQLLFLFCPAYKQLISPASQKSLNIQEGSFAAVIASLENLPAIELAKLFYGIMFSRLIDDESKVPTDMVQAQYHSTNAIRQLLSQRMQNLPEDTAKLDDAIRLLLRAKENSNNPQLYEDFKEVFAPFELSACCP